MTKQKSKILVSSCLLGLETNYKGKGKEIDKLISLWRNGRVVFICPEQIGGLPTPRKAAEIEEGKTAADVLRGNGKVLTKSGANVTEEFLKGAHQTLEVCKKLGVRIAILKAGSPSCGSEEIYDGTFANNKIPGSGIAAELLKQNGIRVFDEEHIPEDLS